MAATKGHSVRFTDELWDQALEITGENDDTITRICVDAVTAYVDVHVLTKAAGEK